MRAKSGFGHAMSGIAMTPEVFLEPKATAATHMGASEGRVVFFFFCVSAAIAAVSGALPIQKRTRT